jgi:hypothetical protein
MKKGRAQVRREEISRNQKVEPSRWVAAQKAPGKAAYTICISILVSWSCRMSLIEITLQLSAAQQLRASPVKVIVRTLLKGGVRNGMQHAMRYYNATGWIERWKF